MPRASQLLAVTLVAGACSFVENRTVRRELAARAPTPALAERLVCNV